MPQYMIDCAGQVLKVLDKEFLQLAARSFDVQHSEDVGASWQARGRWLQSTDQPQAKTQDDCVLRVDSQ